MNKLNYEEQRRSCEEYLRMYNYEVLNVQENNVYEVLCESGEKLFLKFEFELNYCNVYFMRVDENEWSEEDEFCVF